jgi:thiol-disulfide isomerase/thioredoxin
MSVVGLVVVVAVLAAASVFGVVRRQRTGRLRDARREPRLSPDVLGEPLGERATLVQFSSAFCRPCVATRHLLAGVTDVVPGVRHVEVDAESQLELVRSLGIASTPTTLLLDRDGVVRRRAVGVPKRDEVLAALASVVD